MELLPLTELLLLIFFGDSVRHCNIFFSMLLHAVTACGSSQEGFKMSRVGSGQDNSSFSRVGSGRFKKFCNLAGRIGSGEEVSKYHGSGRVGSNQEVLNFRGLGRVGSGAFRNVTGQVRS